MTASEAVYPVGFIYDPVLLEWRRPNPEELEKWRKYSKEVLSQFLPKKKPSTASTIPFKCPTELAGAFKSKGGTGVALKTNRSPEPSYGLD